MQLRFSLTVWLIATVTSLVAAQNYPITGVKVAAGAEVPRRKNINAMYNYGGPQWDLYIRSLVVLYKQDANDRLSYFQIAGIHGRPYIQWNNAGAQNSDGWLGYCPHGESLFLPWHRPYVLAFEQRLVETAISLANGYPAAYRDTYVKAAQTLRSPYWDWAAAKQVPPATVPTTMTIKIPNGSGLKDYTVENPLRIYRFPQAAINQQFGSFARDAQVAKCSNGNYPASANDLLSKRAYKTWVYDAFTRSTTFEQFASTGSAGTSLEQIHNAIHWDGSCGFQFLNADYSAFDPLFMLHHTNVDRLWAYWQFIKPAEATLTRSYRGQARFSSRSNTVINANSPLQPFYAAAGRFHTPDSVKSIKNFGYTYEGLEYWRKSDAQLQKDATAYINNNYVVGSVRLRKRAEEETLTRYFAQVQVDVEQLERPCSIELFANVTSVGNFIVMGQPSSGTFFGKFSLDAAADPKETIDENTNDVVNDLLASLRIEIKKHDGTIIPLDKVPSLKVELENVDIQPAETTTELPEYVHAEHRTAPKKDRQGRGPSGRRQ